jgi:hypothetical protein
MSGGAPGERHPLPESEESRHDLIPEAVVEEKGDGEDGEKPAQSATTVNPDGEPYPSG